MLLLIFISAAGLVLSAAVHFCSLFHIYEPPRGLMMLIYIGAIATIYSAIIISRKTRNEIDVEDYKKAIFFACPKWLSMMNGFFIMYVLGGLIFLVFKRYFVGSSVANEQGIPANGFRGFSGHWMVFYSLALALLCSCRRLKGTS